MEPTDLVAVVSRAVTAGRAAAPNHEVTLVAPDEAVIDGDAHRLRQVVDNLLANALRHSPTGVAVEVRVTAAPDAVTIEVGDHGAGVPAADRERIFEPFYRADSSRARATGGAGLGLAIVAAIARAHGGTVGVEPNGHGRENDRKAGRGNGDGTDEGNDDGNDDGNGTGARFWVRLPTGPAVAPSSD